MKDSELRAIVLKFIYERRRERAIEPKPDDFTPPVPMKDLMDICDQLGQNHLIDWKPTHMRIGTVHGFAKITAAGIDVVENEGRGAPVEFIFPMSQHITFNSPSNVQIGNQNTQSIIQTFNDIIEQIDSSSASPKEKAEAKSKLKAFLEHPLVTSLIGSVVSGIVGLANENNR